MTILGLDLSLTATGWAVSPDEFGVERTAGKFRGTDRLVEYRYWLKAMCDRYAPAQAVLEGYSFGSRGRAVFSIAEWGGIARLVLVDRGVPFVEVAPAVLKKYATGRGNAPKPDMRMELFKRSGLDVADDNAVDALWLLAIGRELAGRPLWSMPKINRDALSKLEVT